MKFFKILFLFAFLSACMPKVEFEDHPMTERANHRTGMTEEQKKIKELETTIMNLQGTIDQINAFVASDFSDCETGLPAFEEKICKIAKTAMAEGTVEYISPIQRMIKIFQDSLYGDDCMDTVTVGCPVEGSITEQFTNIEDNSVIIAQLQTDVLQLQLDMNAIETRLDDFDGSGQTVEAVINGINTEIIAIDDRLNGIENAINNGDIYKTFFICDDIYESGPIYTRVEVTGDDTKVMAYLFSTSKNGMGVLAEAGISGNQYLQTKNNTRWCKFKIYDLVATVKLCWDNSDRKALESEIDTECDAANDFLNPTANCTCKN